MRAVTFLLRCRSVCGGETSPGVGIQLTVSEMAVSAGSLFQANIGKGCVVMYLQILVSFL